ncbi:hypothetical protein TNCV_3426291 [Trichonephila clavipes]|nr:hypothetical protein TNCV_3426291 [Trichonephila clavipes]
MFYRDWAKEINPETKIGAKLDQSSALTNVEVLITRSTKKTVTSCCAGKLVQENLPNIIRSVTFSGGMPNQSTSMVQDAAP